MGKWRLWLLTAPRWEQAQGCSSSTGCWGVTQRIRDADGLSGCFISAVGRVLRSSLVLQWTGSLQKCQ